MEHSGPALNEPQAEAVAHGEGPALIIAGAGSGKTRVITGRAVRLISSGVSPWSIFCVTFTNKAAQEMRDRVSGSLGIDTSLLWISTFHSACLRILKEEYKHLNYPSMPTVFDASDQKSLVKSIIKEMGIADADLPAKRVLSLISRFKSDMKGPEHMAAELKSNDSKNAAEAFHKYEQELRRNNAVDFDDLLNLTIKLFTNVPEVLADYRERFQYIMVDEFQDTNLSQYKIIRLLAGEKGNIFAVGDDDQSIYRWRGAKVGNILGFEKDFPGSKVIKLEENYRSTANILKAAGSVVKEVYSRKEKTLFTKSDAGAPITVFTGRDEVDEAVFVASEIMAKVRGGEAVFGDFSVFYRTNAQSRVIEECLNRTNIPYRIYGGQKFYNRKEIKDMMAYFRLAVNELEEVSFIRAVSTPPRGIGNATLGKLKTFAQEKGISLLAASRIDDNGIKGAAKDKLAEFGELVYEIRSRAASDPASEVIDTTLERTGIVSVLLSKRTAQDNARVENLKELAGAPHETETLADFLERVSLLAEADRVEESSDFVSLMTVHVSKGLEFPTVFLVGMEENLFPHFNSLEGIEELDEERRLCYVGMTRAMKKLYLCHAVSRRIYGQFSVNLPSPFIKDVPEDIVEKIGSSPQPAASAPTGAPVGAKKSYNYASPPRMAGKKKEPGIDMGDGFGVGKMVLHSIFGKGVIKKREGGGDNLNLTIIFREAGMKKLKSRFVKPAA
jgi:DNA helicase-2/ATP-dependent DNA helicase PcrA